MVTRNRIKQHSNVEKRRIRISSKRQITIPVDYYEELGLDNEVDCICAKDMLILIPVRNENSYFAEEILSDLVKEGYSGEELLTEFRKANRKIRPAVEKLINEADRIAESVSYSYFDKTDDIFGDIEGLEE